MPYIAQNDRHDKVTVKTTSQKTWVMSRRDIGEAVGQSMRNGGDFQYIIAVAFQVYLERVGLRYQNCQDIMGALSGGLAEFIRCVVSPYEKEKITDNGGVYDMNRLGSNDY